MVVVVLVSCVFFSPNCMFIFDFVLSFIIFLFFGLHHLRENKRTFFLEIMSDRHGRSTARVAQLQFETVRHCQGLSMRVLRGFKIHKDQLTLVI